MSASQQTLPPDSLQQISAPAQKNTVTDKHMEKTLVKGCILPSIKQPADVAKLSSEELGLLAKELRQKIIETTAQNGGHLAPSLGVVDLTLAMLSIFDAGEDKIIWDVGHQAYAYKLLTGRANTFHTLRQKNGISGFPRREESPFDHFGVGHSSTSISAALGMAVARDLAGKKHHVVSVIGDGSLTAGLAFEGLNQAGAKDRPFIVILNDNEMSIAKNVGALSLFMSRNLSSRWVRRVKREVENFLQSVPGIGEDLVEIAKRSKHSFKNFFTPGILFEALHFNYIGPVDGHDIGAMQEVLRLAASLEKPVLVHVLTQKGKGYAPAENCPANYHGVGKFSPETGISSAPATSGITYTEAMGSTLSKLATKDSRIVAITAAMPEGTGLSQFAKQFPDRFFDVGICEQHAVTFAAGLATQGYKPFVCIYSTFLQRAYDQIIHDVCIQNLPVTFCIDRSGLVGEDGATHQGVFDMSFLRHIPNMTILAPKDEKELANGLATAICHTGPFAIRYPRGFAPGDDLPVVLEALLVGKSETICEGNGKLAVIAIGNTVTPAFTAIQHMENSLRKGITLVNARWIKPLDKEALKKVFTQHDKIVLVEEHVLQGGFSSAVLEFASDTDLIGKKECTRLGLPDQFIEHGSTEEMRQELGLHANSLEVTFKKLLGQ